MKPSTHNAQMIVFKAFASAATVFGLLVLGTVPSHAEQPPLEQSLVVLDFAIERPYIKTSEYCDGVAEALKKTGPGFAQLSRKDALGQLQGHLGPKKTNIEPDLKALKAKLNELEELIYAKPRKAVGPLKTIISKLQKLDGKASAIADYRKLFFEAHMSLARAQNDSRDKKGLRKTLVALISFVGDAKVTDESYHPDVVKAWNKAKSDVAANRTAKLKVTVKPQGAEVLINGQPLGEKAPITVTWFPGEVFVQARSESGLSQAKKILLEDAKTTEVAIDLEYEASIDLSGDRALITFPSRAVFQSRAGDFAKRLAKLLDIDTVAWCGLTQTATDVSLEGHLVDGKTGNTRWGTAMGTKANVVSKLRTNAMAMFIANGGARAKESGTDGVIWYENAIGWTLLAVGLVGAGVGTAFHFIYEDTEDQVYCTGDYTPPTGLCEDIETRNDLAEDAELERAIRNTGFVAAGLGIVGGILVMALMQPDSKPSDKDVATPTLRAISPWVGPARSGVSLSVSF